MQTDVLVIGSSAAGLVAATTGKRIHSDKEFMVITCQNKTLIPCGIPYIFGSVGSTEKNILPAEKAFESMGIKIVYDEVIKIERENKLVKLKSGKEVKYSKLIIGTGSLSVIPDWLKGATLENVFSVQKSKVYIDQMQEKLKTAKKIVTIGAGFIGVEISDELVKIGKEVVLIEKLHNILGLAFDEDISLIAKKILSERGVKIMTNIGVQEIIGETKVEGVILENGEKIDADAVILAIGYKPNTKLAQECGLEVNR